MALTPVRKAPTDHDPQAVTWARKAKRWKQSQLARALDISPALMSYIESGERNAGPELLDRLAQVLNCPTSMLERKHSDQAA